MRYLKLSSISVFTFCVYMYENLNLFSLDLDQIIFRQIKKEESERRNSERERKGERIGRERKKQHTVEVRVWVLLSLTPAGKLAFAILVWYTII